MTPDERRLIQDLFDRMRGIGRIDKDRDAEALIHQLVNAHPDSLYMLVQNVLVQEHALNQSEQRMQELEAENEALRRPAQSQQGSGGGSFLGGLFGGGGGRPAPSASAGFGGAQRVGSVPSAGPLEAPRQTPWGNTGAAQSGGFQGTSAPQQPMAQQPARSGGGFLSGAMSTAAGVAGGMLAANAIGSMLGGGHGGGLFGGGNAHQTQSNQPLPGPQDGTQQASNADNGLTDEDYDIDTVDDSGGDDSMDV